MSRPASVELVHVTKRFHATLAVHDLTLTIYNGEFFALLGPSGCGKSTTLRLIGGLESPDSGEIRIGGAAVHDQPPYVRRVNIVFQHYALFPHLTVQDNVAFGLRVQGRRVPEAETARRVKAVLELVQLGGLETRRPQQLSGGQQQRVALARALVLRPHVLLLDEPLGALDRQLRKTMQTELRRIQREVGMTFLYVTHDQDEALSMSDRMAVMRQGTIEQLGIPQDIFQTPRTKFVAEFMGAANIFTGRVLARTEHTVHLETPSGLRMVCQCNAAVAVGTALSVVVRPDVVQVVPHGWTWTGDNAFSGRVLTKTYLGEVTALTVTLPAGDTVLCHVPSRLEQQFGYQEATAVLVGWQAQDAHVLQE
ncbi:MAG TPA: ABC transporter ATP-binding protein [Candidatus Tectomicrobia bacterium]